MDSLQYCILFVVILQLHREINSSYVNTKGDVDVAHNVNHRNAYAVMNQYTPSRNRVTRSDDVDNTDYVVVVKALCQRTKHHRERVGAVKLLARDRFDDFLNLCTQSPRAACFLKRHFKCMKRLFTSSQEDQLRHLKNNCPLNNGDLNQNHTVFALSGDPYTGPDMHRHCTPFDNVLYTTAGANSTIPTELQTYINVIERRSDCRIDLRGFLWRDLFEPHFTGEPHSYKFKFHKTNRCKRHFVCRLSFIVEIRYCPDLELENVRVSDPIHIDGTTDYQVELSCEHSGYDLLPARSRTIRCINYERWEEYNGRTRTTCIPRQCTEQPDISQNHVMGSCELRSGNEIITHEPSHAFRGSNCWLRCIEGTLPVESAGTSLSVTCGDDLTWNFEQLTPCEAMVEDPEISCPAVVAVAGEETFWDEPVAHARNGGSTTVTRDSDNMYAPGHEFQLDCGNPVYCVKRISYTATDSDGYFSTCDVVVNVTSAHCDEIEIDNGYVTCDSTVVGTVCRFGCHGFTFLSGPENATCVFDDVTDSVGWLYSNGQTPTTCKPYPCTSPAAFIPENGSVNCSRSGLNNICTATCDPIFTLPFELLDLENPEEGYRCYGSNWYDGSILQCPDPHYATGVRYISSARYTVPGTCPTVSQADVLTEYTNGMGPYCSNPEEGDDDLCVVSSAEVLELRVCNSSDQYDIVLEMSHTLLHPTSDGDTWSPDEITASIDFVTVLSDALQSGYFTIFDWTLEVVSFARTIECDEGLAPALGNVNLCVPCSLGSFYRTEECPKCARGSYQNLYGQTGCMTCPTGQSTKLDGAVHASSCVEICLAGTYSTTGLQPCIPCPANTYQGDAGQNECTDCPDDTVTAQISATDYSQCFSPVGDCTEEDCSGNGQCESVGSLTACTCDDGFYGDRCESGTDTCASNNCANGATCAAVSGTYVCECPDPFTGHYCDATIMDGEWGAWADWTICPNCTEGASFQAEQSRLRTCSNPAPQNGGDDCVGDSVETRACVLSPCGECPEFPTRENSIIDCIPSEEYNGDHYCTVVCDAGYELGPGETIIKCGPTTDYELITIDDEAHEVDIISIDQLSTLRASCAGSAPLIEYSQTVQAVFPVEDDDGCTAESSCGGNPCECTNRRRKKREAFENYYTIILRFNVTSAVEHFFIDGVFDNATAVAAQDEMFNQSVAIANELAIIWERIENGTYSIIIGEHEYFPNPDSFQVIESQRCPTGMLLDGLRCRNCSVGSYQDDRYDSCLACPLGQYQGLEGQTSCHTCPDNMTTNTTGSMFIEHCVPLNPESCPAGSYLDETECIRCPVGNYQDNVNETRCIPCDVGTYQAAIGQDLCRVCPDGQTTDYIGSTSLDDCWINPDVCGQGTYQYGGTCEDCPYGYYQNRVGQSYCEPCNIFATTNTRGSTSSQDCVLAYETYDEICDPGTYNHSYGCANCSVGDYQPYRGQPSCYECPSGMTTNDIGSTELSQCVDDSANIADNSKKTATQDVDATTWAIVGAVIGLFVLGGVVLGLVFGIKHFHNRNKPKDKRRPQERYQQPISNEIEQHQDIRTHDESGASQVDLQLSSRPGPIIFPPTNCKQITPLYQSTE